MDVSIDCETEARLTDRNGFVQQMEVFPDIEKLNFPTKVVAFSFFEPMSEREAKRDGVKGLERREDMIRRNYFTGIR